MTSRSRTAWTVVITLLAGGGLSETARAQARQEAIDRGRAFLLAQQRADGRIAGRLDVLATARLTSALRAAGTEPEDLSEHLATAAAASGDAVEVAAALSASDDEGLVAALLGLEGPPGDFGSLLATAAAAQVLAERSPDAAARALDALTAADDGTVGDGRDRVLLTAAALLAFAAGDRDAEAAVAALEACRRDDGGFGDIEETALAVQALAAAGRPVDGSSVAWLTRALDQPVSPRTRAAVLQAGLAAGDPHDRFSAAALAMAAAVDPDGVFLGGRSNRDTAALLEALDPAADEDGRDAAARWLLRPLQDGAPTADSALRTLALAELAETDAPGVGRLLARQRPDGGCPARAGDQPDPLSTALCAAALKAAGQDAAASQAAAWLADAARPAAGLALGTAPAADTYLAGRVLALLGAWAAAEPYATVVAAAHAALAAAARDDATFGEGALDTAAALHGLLLAPDPPDPADLDAGMAALVDLQEDDGSWAGGDAYVTARAVAALDLVRCNLAAGQPTVLPDPPVFGQETEVRVPIVNRGLLPAGGFFVTLLVAPLDATAGDEPGDEPPYAVEPVAVGDPVRIGDPLAPGDDRLVPVRWDTASHLGPVRVCARVDTAGGQREVSRLDNLACADVEVYTLPDLVVTPAHITFDPPAPLAGEGFTVAARIRNASFGPAGSFLARLVLGRPGEGEVLGDFPMGAGLAPRTGRRISLGIPPGAFPAGGYLLCAVADAEAAVDEADETNNTTCVPFSILAHAGPDAALADGLFTVEPDVALPGEPLELIARLRNTGARAIARLDVGFFSVPADGVPELVAPLSEAVGIAPGEQREVRVRWSAPERPGEVVLAAVLDPAGRVDEADEDNNRADALLRVRALDSVDLAPGVDLTTSPGTAIGGQPLALRVRVDNHGGRPATHVAVRTVLGLPAVDGVLVGPDRVLEVIPGLSSAVAEVPLTLSAGVHTLTVVVDPRDTIAEAREDDNTRSYEVSVTPPAGVDLAVAPDGLRFLPDPPRPPMAVSVEVDLDNLGGLPAGPFTVRLVEGPPGAGPVLGQAGVPGLAAGARTRIWLDTRLGAGFHDLSVEVDPEAATHDLDRSNNRARWPVVVPSPGAADLAVRGAELSALPPVPAAGEPVHVRATLRNLGGQAARDVTVVLVEAGAADDEPRGRTTVDRLAPGAAAAVAFEVSLPVGRRDLCVEVVPPEGRHQGRVDNDRACLLLDVRPPANARAADVRLDPERPRVGSPATVTVTVENTGEVPLPGESAVSVSFVAADGAVEVGTAAVPAPPPGEAVTVDVPWAVAGPAGRGELVVTLDPDDAWLELREDDNDLRRPLFVTVPGRAELSVSADAIEVRPRRPRIDQPLTVVFPVSNYGDGPTPPFPVAVLVGEPGAPLFEGSARVEPLAAGEQAEVSVAWDAPEPGVHTLTVVVDPAQVVVESDRSDNTAVTELVLLNRPPELHWSGGLPEYARGGVAPRFGSTETELSFQVRYSDVDGDPPAEGFPRVRIDLDGDGQHTLAGEGALALQALDPDDDDVLDGKLYGVTTTLPATRNLRYRFDVVDTFGDAAVGEPAPLVARDGPWVLDGPHARAMPAYTTWVGRGEIVLWGHVWPGPDAGLTCAWDFGDGSDVVEVAVDDPRYVEAWHVYDALGVYTVRMTATDGAGRSHTARTVVSVQEDSRPVRRAAILGDTLRYLYRQQEDDGRWELGNEPYPEAVTATALLALQNNQHREEDDLATSIFAPAIRAGLDYLLWTARVEDLGVAFAPFDRNGNGRFVHWSGVQPIYTSGLTLLALLASEAPAEWGELVQDGADWLLLAQSDNGGWRYTARAGADNSASQWPVLALAEGARCPFDADVPDWVWAADHPEDPYGTGLASWLDSSHDPDTGAFGYVGAGAEGVPTAAALMGLWALGEPVDAPRVDAALTWLGNRIVGGWYHMTYFSYSLAKALRLYQVQSLGGRDWFSEMTGELELRQDQLSRDADRGGFLWASYPGHGVANAAMAALALTETVVGDSPVADAGEDRIVFPDEEVCFDGSGSHHPSERRRIVGYAWDFDGDGADDAWGVRACTSFAAGEHTVRLRVTDDACAPRHDEAAVHVLATDDNHPPVAHIEPPAAVFVGLRVLLDGRGSTDPDGDELVFSWDVDGDGEYDDGAGDTLPVRYSERSQVLVGLSVCDPEGLCDTTRLHLDVLDVRLSEPSDAPDPFSPGSADGVRDESFVHFSSTDAVAVSLAVFDAAGERVRTVGPRAAVAGGNLLVWDGRDDAGEVLPSGRYRFKLVAGDRVPAAGQGFVEREEPLFAVQASERGVGGPAPVRLPDGVLRLYFTSLADPDVIRSARRDPGGPWVREDGVRLGPGGPVPDARDAGGAAEPSVDRLGDGSIRVYYTGTGAGGERRVLSATSLDGLTFTRDPGVRLGDAGDLPDGAWSPSALRLDGDRVRLFFVAPDAGGLGAIRSADSEDGLDFVVAGVPHLDAGLPGCEGGVGSPEAVRRPDGQIELLFSAVDTDGVGRIRRALSEDGLTLSPQPGAVRAATDDGGVGSSYRSDGTQALLYGADGAGMREAVRDPEGDVALDDEPPTATLAPPGAGDLLGDVWTLRGTATDDDGEGLAAHFAGYDLWVTGPDGGEVLAAEGGAPVVDGLLASVELAELRSGTYTVRLQAADRAGNRAGAEARWYVRLAPLDPPVIDRPTRAGEPLVVSEPAVAIAGRAEPGSTVDVTLDGDWIGLDVAGADGRWALPPVVLSAGAHDIVAQASFEGVVSEPSAPVTVTLDAVSATVETDRAAYAFGDPVAVTATVLSEVPGRRGELVVTRPGGERVARLGVWTVEEPVRQARWTPGDEPAGDYEVTLRVFPSWARDELLAEARAAFTLQPERALALTLEADRDRYGAHDAARLSASARAAAGNAAWRALTGRFEVRSADGARRLEPAPAEVALGDLPPGQSRRVEAVWETGTVAPGAWVATWTVSDAGGVVGFAEAPLQVVATATDGAGLTGRVAVDPVPVERGEPESVCVIVSNGGNADVAGLSVLLRLAAPAPGAEAGGVQLDARALDLARGAAADWCLEVDSADLAVGEHVVSLSALPADGPVLLDAAGLEVVDFAVFGEVRLDDRPRLVGLLGGPDWERAGQLLDAAAGVPLRRVFDGDDLRGLLEAGEADVVALAVPVDEAPPPFDGVTMLARAAGPVEVRVVHAGLRVPAALLLETAGATELLAAAPSAGGRYDSELAPAAGAPFALVLRVFAPDLTDRASGWEIPSTDPRARVTPLGLGAWRVAWSAGALGAPWPEEPDLVVEVQDSAAGAPAVGGEALLGAVADGGGVVSLRTTLGPELDARLFGARIAGDLPAGDHRLVPTGRASVPFASLPVSGRALALRPDGGRVDATLEADTSAPGPVPAIVLPADGALELTVESVSPLSPQRLGVLHPRPEAALPFLVPGRSVVLDQVAEPGELLVLRLFADLRARGGPSARGLDTGGAGTEIERTGPWSWGVRFRLGVVPDGGDTARDETAVRVRLHSAGAEPWPVAVTGGPGPGRATLLAVDPAGEEGEGWAGLLRSLLQGVTPDLAHPRAGQAVRVVVTLRTSGLPARGDLSLELAEGVEVLDAGEGEAVAGAVVWPGLALEAPAARTVRLRLPAQAGPVTLRARLERVDRPADPTDLGELVIPVRP